MNLATDLKLAWRNIARNRRRSAVALGAVAFGVLAALLSRGFIDWMIHEFQEQAIRSQFGHLQIARSGFFESGTADPFRFLIPERSSVAATVGRDPRVDAIAPRLNFTGLVARGDATTGFIGTGVDPRAEPGNNQALRIIAGETLSADESNGVLLGQGLAASIGARVGDTVVALANGPSGGLGGLDVRVRGIFATVSRDYDDVAMRLPLRTAQQVLRTNRIHTWVVTLAETRFTETVATDLAQRLAADGLEVAAWPRLAQFYVRAAQLLSDQVAVVQLIIVVIVILGMLNSLTISVIERTGEIGTVLAMGVSRRRVLRQFVVEGLLLGVLGSLLGVLAALGAAAAISRVGIPMPPAPGMATGFVAQIALSPSAALEAIAVATLVAAAASAYPAWKASRLDIVDALRHNG